MLTKFRLSLLTRNIFILFITWRVILFFTSFLSIYILPRWGGRFPYVEEILIGSGFPYWLWQWGNFDGVHYLTIAKSFYSAYYTQTFFPFYPILIMLISKITFITNYLTIALLVSNIFFLFCLIIFSKLLKLEKFTTPQIYWTLIFLIVFPTSYYFGAVYTESIFLFMTLLFYYLVKKMRWIPAGLVGLLSSATKLLGVFLTSFFVYDFIIKIKKHQKIQIREIVGFLLVFIGLFSYMFYLQAKFNDFLLFWHSQPVFGAGRLGSGIILPPQVIYRYLKILVSVSPGNIAFFTALQELLAFLSAIFLLWVGYSKKINISYLLYALIVIVVPSLTGTLSSMPRYILIAFPIYMILGKIKNTYLKLFLVTVFLILLLINTTLFLRGYWVS